jgi:peptidoglycan/LPS O-acetylase OafA/YrhL
MTGSLTRQPQDRIRELDGLRGIACALVLLWHLVNRQVVPQGGFWGWTARSLSQSWSGVDLFFVLSGYLIIRNLSRDRENVGWVRRFVLARVFRLVPAYALLIAGCAALTAWVAHSRSASASVAYLVEDSHPWWVYMTYFQNWYPILVHVRHPLGSEFMSVTWSLGAEVEFYLGSVALFLFCPARLRLKALLCAAAAAALFRAFIFSTYPFPGISALILPPARMDGFALGGCAALWLENPLSRSEAVKLLPAMKASWAFLFLWVLFLTFTEAPFIGKIPALFSYACFAVFYSLSLVIIVLRAGSPTLAWIRRGPLAGLGIISYGVYLFHKPFHFLFADRMKITDSYLTFPGGAGYLLLELSLTLLFSTIVWKCLEKPTIKLGRRVANPDLGRSIRD